MIPVGQVYRPAGSVDARSVLSATILGAVTAVFAALVVWAWELSPIPTLVIITPLLQGCLIGLVLVFVIGRLRLRHPALMMLVGLACALASIGLVHYGHYLHFLDQIGAEYKTFVESAPNLSPERKQEMLAKPGNSSGELADNILLEKTGHRGFLGSMLHRSEIGVTIKHAKLTGWGVWILWALEALAVAVVAGLMARSRAAEPFCEDCGDWCSKAQAPFVIAGDLAKLFAEAVGINDIQKATQILGQPVFIEIVKRYGTRGALHSCGECDQTFADVESYQVLVNKKKTETKTTSILKRVRISPEMTALLRQPPSNTSTTLADDPDPVADEPATLEPQKS